ncbi:MAG: substrate-binding domain-containing protein [Kiritimatiellae bacterium]|nr:substrate-binding domain-containing protein [Kiritimatiellia bacterium]
MGQPAYIRIQDQLKRDIRRGRWKEGEGILSETEICRSFGVSRITAIRALNELSSAGFVRREKGKRSVLVSRGGRRDASFVNVLIANESHVWQPLCRALGRCLHDANMRLLNYNIEHMSEESPWEEIVSSGGAATVIEPARALGPQLHRFADRIPFPLYVMWDPETGDCPGARVLSDFLAGGYEQARHAIAGGYARCIFYTHARLGSPSQEAMISGAEKACREKRMTLKVFDVYAAESEEREIATAQAMLKDLGRNTAVLCEADWKAVIIHRAVQAMGWHVPGDVGLVGYWDTPWSEALSLSSVSPRVDAMAGEAARLILDRKVERVIVPPMLVARSSVRR